MKSSRSKIRSTEILFHVLSGMTLLVAMSDPIEGTPYAALAAGFFFAASITESRRMYGHYAVKGKRSKPRPVPVTTKQKRKR